MLRIVGKFEQSLHPLALINMLMNFLNIDNCTFAGYFWYDGKIRSDYCDLS